MTNQDVMQVAIKLANKYNEAWKEQRARLETFYYDTSRFLKALITEMDGDLATLKHRQVHGDVTKMFADIAHQLTDLYVDIDPEHPYTGMARLVNWVESKPTKIKLDNLQFLIKEYLKKTKPDIEQTAHVKHSAIDSIRKLLVITPKLRSFMDAHPLLPDPRSTSTVPPPMEKNKEILSLGPDDETKQFPIGSFDVSAE
jgi:hypothetical protein